MGDGSYSGGGYIEGYPWTSDFRSLVFSGRSSGGYDDSGFDLGSFLLGILLLASGILSVSSPETTWYLSRGWKYKNAEPSDTYLTFIRITGVLSCVIGLGIFISSCSRIF
jgi:hypothetical protein